jgi:CDP-diacylglycerol--glycerol-3-phosphate 3-phosphatidyltransferase
VDLYRSKSGIVAGLDPVVQALARRQVSPDAVTLAAIPVAALAAACLFGSPSLPGLLLAVPVLAGARLILNLLDGALARRTERMHPRGELLNELGDRVADVLFLAPVAFLPGADMATVLVGVLLGVLASYVGVASRAAGGRRIYRGILSKPGRMVLLGVFAIVVLVSGSDAWGVFGVVLLAGASATFVERIVVAIRELH